MEQTTANLEGPTRHNSDEFVCTHCAGNTSTLSYETSQGVWWHQCSQCGELKEDAALVDE